MAVTEGQARTVINEVFDACSARNPRAGYGAAITEGARLIRAELGGRHWKRVSASEALSAARKVQARLDGRRPAPGRQEALAEAAAAAVARATATRKAVKKAAKRTAREAADRALVDRMVAERLQAARLFGEASIGRTLSETSREDLALIAATAMSGGPAPATRPVVEMAVDPAALPLEDLGVAAVVGSAGASPFWTGQTSGQSPFFQTGR